MSLTVVGTLVDLVPEMLLVTEILMHPGVTADYGSMGTILRMMFSDGKPVIVFAATEEHEKPLSPSLLLVRDSLRRRLASVAASLSMRDGCFAGVTPKWTYAGLVGVLVGGEFLTAIGACLFLRIEFSWAALISLAASVVALLVSVRCHMRAVGETELHACHASPSDSGGRLIEFLLPGPMTFARFLLIVPVWPMLLVYSESASFWPFSMANDGDHSLPSSENALWVSPTDWLRVGKPTLSVSDNDSPLSFLYWTIVPHLLWTLVSVVWVGLLGLCRIFCWYFGHTEDWSAHPWGVYFASQESPFHVWSRNIQGALGLGLTTWLAKDFKRLLLFSGALAGLLFESHKHGACVEQEWAFVFAHASWWAIMLMGHAARKKNVFKVAPPTDSARVADRW